MAAAPEDQYPINTGSVTWHFEGEGQGLGKDWAVFTVNENANTGLTPFVAQGGFFPHDQRQPGGRQYHSSHRHGAGQYTPRQHGQP
ncbi:MAG: hypothetical protein M5U34_49240 [Chloroflexi bacterium]|nr:hypothetical protein [Chloroflexota bacterium]